MRRFLLGITLIFVIGLAGGVSILYVMRDRILLREARLQTEKLSPLHVEIGSLHTKIFGAFAIELEEIEVRNGEAKTPLLRLRDVHVESSLGLPALCKAYLTKEELPLLVSVNGAKFTAPREATSKPPANGPAAAFALPAVSPIPLRLGLNVRNAEIDAPSWLVKGLTIKADSRGGASGLAASFSASAGIGPKGGASLPLAVEAKLALARDSLKISSLAVHSAGVNGSGGAELSGDPLRGAFRLSFAAPDLAKLPLSASDKAALGFTDQPGGSFALDVDGKTTLGDSTDLQGTLRADSLVLPFRGPERTLLAGFSKMAHGEGSLALNLALPFRAHLSAVDAPRITISDATAAVDLTDVSLAAPGRLEKPRKVPLRAKARFSITPQKEGLSFLASSFELEFHHLSASGTAALPAPLGSQLSSDFRIAISSLAGFPSLLPSLRAAEAGSASDAQGTVQASGSVRLLPAAPASSFVDLKTLVLKGLHLPLAYSGSALSLQGVLSGAASGGLRYNAGDVNVSRTSGGFDLTSLEIAVPGKFVKKRGRRLLVSFDAQGTPARLAVRKASVVADGLSASLSGTAAFDKNRNAALALNAAAHADLTGLRDYLPKLPAKISSGSFDASLRVGGTWQPSGGLEKSPLLVSGKIGAKLGSVVMAAPVAEAAATKGPPPQALLPPWPAARNAAVAFRADVAQFERGSLQASGISAAGSLGKGAFTANANVAKVFGGKAALRGLSGSLLSPKLAVRGAAAVDGLDLSRAAGFVDPSYGKIVKGTLKADSTFSVPDVWSEKLMMETTAAGSAQVKGGYVSTASFTSLVADKLKAVPGLGDKAKSAGGGLSADIRTQFAAASGTAKLTAFDAITPQRDEMKLDGTMNLAFDCDLSGTAHLASAPVTGAVREANSDPQGRLVVPVRFHGNLKSPEVDIATNAIQEMLKNTAAFELNRQKDEALGAAKQKAQDALKGAAKGLLDQLGK